MSLRKTLDRNRQMKKIAQSVQQKWEKATIYSIDGNRANIRLGSSPNLIRHVEVTGDTSSLAPGQELPILWKDNRPVVVQSGAVQSAVSSGVSEGGREDPVFLKLFQSVSQSLPSSQDVILTFDTVLTDTVRWFDTAAPDRIVIQKDGLYFISAEVGFTSGTTGNRKCAILINETEFTRSQYPNNAQVIVHASCVTPLRVGDIVQVVAYQNNGTAFSTIISTDSSYPAVTLARLGDTVTLQQTNNTTIINQGGSEGTAGPHASTHQTGGTDEIHVTNLSGLLADPQNAGQIHGRAISSTAPTDGQALGWNAAASQWEPTTIASVPQNPPFGLSVVLGDVSSTLTTGLKGYIEVPYNCTLTAVTLIADVAGSCQLEIWKGTYASLPTVANNICASSRPVLSSAQKYQDTTLLGWTKTLSAGDVLAINVNSATTVHQVTLALRGVKS